MAHERLLAEVSRCVPSQAAKHLVHCRLVDGRLRLVLDNAAWVARLRFGERQLLKSLAAGGTRVRQVSWHVAPPEPIPPGDPRLGARRAPRRLAEAQPRAAAHVASVAADQPDDALGRALRNLAATMKRRTGRRDPD